MKQTLHYKIQGVAKRLLGIDLEEEGVKGLNDLGCECYCSLAEDAHYLNIGKLDNVLLGDIIEHIPDPPSSISSLRDYLNRMGY